MNQHALTKAQPKPSLVPTALKIEKNGVQEKLPLEANQEVIQFRKRSVSFINRKITFYRGNDTFSGAGGSVKPPGESCSVFLPE